MLRIWLGRRVYTGLLVGVFAVWYAFQRIVAAEIGVVAAAPWFYFTPEPATGWLFAPLSHNMADIGHLLRNLTNLVLVGAFTEPHFDTRRYLKLLAVITGISIIIPVIGSAVLIDGFWLVAGPSGGIYGIWAFTSVFRVDVIRLYRDWMNFESVDDWRMFAEAVMAVFGLLLIVIVPVNDLLFSTGRQNVIAHLAGILSGLVLGELYRRRMSD